MRRSIVVCLIVALAPVLGPAPSTAQTGSLESRREEARRLEQQIGSQGERLSVASEEYNEAVVARQEIEADLARSREEVAQAEVRWRELKSRLGKRVRAAYMQPGGWLSSLFGTKSVDELARKRVLAGSVLSNDTELLQDTALARTELEQQAGALADLRRSVQAKERDLESRRDNVQAELERQQQLLRTVEGDIAEALEAERRRELAAAAELARQEASRTQEPRREAPAVADVKQPPPAAAEPSGPPPAVRNGAAQAVATAREQIGKPYKWGAEGPDSFDCSGLTKYAWASAGVNLPHSSRAQYSSLPKVAKSDLRPGDLLFFGNPIHHVGIYEGDGVMINAPQTGENVRRSSIYRRDYTGAARP